MGAKYIKYLYIFFMHIMLIYIYILLPSCSKLVLFERLDNPALSVSCPGRALYSLALPWRLSQNSNAVGRCRGLGQVVLSLRFGRVADSSFTFRVCLLPAASCLSLKTKTLTVSECVPVCVCV